MKCEKCKSILFKIQIIPCCGDCIENGAWDEDSDEFTHDLKIIMTEKLTRNEVEENSECGLGSAYGEGCHVYICACCNYKTHLPMVGGC